MLESDEQKIIRYYLKQLEKKLSIKHWRIPVEGRQIGGKMIANELKGFPDILLCFYGHFVALECKAEKGRVSKVQKETHLIIEESLGSVAVVRSVAEVAGFLVQTANKLLADDLGPIVSGQLEAELARLDSNKQIKRFRDRKQKADAAPANNNDQGLCPVRQIVEALDLKGT